MKYHNYFIIRQNYYKSNKLLLSDCAGNVFILNQDRFLNSETQLQHLLTVSNENEKYNFIYGKIFKIIILLTATMDVYIYDVRKDVSTLKQTLILEPKSQDGQFMSSDKLFITFNEKLPLLVVTTLINIYCICWNDRKQEWNYIAKLNLYDLNNLMLPGPEFLITQGGITACNWNPNQSSELLIGTGLGALLSYKILQWRYIYPQYNHLTISYIPYGIFLITNEPLLGMSNNNNNNQKQQQYTLLLRRTTIRPDQPQDLIILFYPPRDSRNFPPNFVILCLANGKRMCVTNLIDKTSVIIDLKVTILQKCKNLFVSAPTANKLLSKNNNTIEGLPKFNQKYYFLLLNNDRAAVLRNRIGNSQGKSIKQDAATSHYHFLILAASKSQKIDVNRPHPRCQIIAFKTDLYFMNTFDFIPESSYIHSCYGDDNNNNNFSPPNFFNRQRPNSNLKIVVLNQRNTEKESLDAEGNDVVPYSLLIRIGYIDGNVINIVDVLLYPPYHENSNMDPKKIVASYKHSEDSINSLEMSPITANHVSFMDNRRNFYLWSLLNPTSASSESSRQPSVIKLCTNLGKNLYRWFVWPDTNNTALIYASELPGNNIPNNSIDKRKSFNLCVLYQTEPSTSEKLPFQKFKLIVQGKPYDLVYSGSSGLLHLITKTSNKEYFNLYELKFPWPPPQTAHSKSDEKRHRQKTDNIGTNKVLNCQLIDALNDGERMNDVYDIVTEHFDVAQTAILSLNLFNNVEERGDEKSPFPPIFVQLLKSLDGDSEFDDLKHLPYYPMNYSIKADGTKKKIKLFLSKRSPILRLLKDLLTGNLGDLDKILTVAAVSGEPEATFLENIKALILTYTKLDLWQDALVLYKKHQSHLSLLPRGTKPILRDGENEKEEDEGISTHNLSYEFLCQGYVDWLKVTRQYSRLANFSFKELHDPKQALKYYVKAGDIQKCEEMLENLDHYEDVESQIGTDLIKELIEDLIKAEHYKLAADIFLKLPIDVASDLLMEEKSGHHTTDNEVNVTPLVKSSKNSKTPVARNNKFKKLNSSLKPVGKLNNILGVKERILNLYKAGNAYPQALTIAKEYFPGRVTELEECWGDYFVALATKHKTIKTPPFNYPDTKDELLNLLLLSQSSELPINNNNTLLPNLDREILKRYPQIKDLILPLKSHHGAGIGAIPGGQTIGESVCKPKSAHGIISFMDNTQVLMNCKMAINHYIEAGAIIKAVRAALDFGDWENAEDILQQQMVNSETRPLFEKLADHYTRTDDYERALTTLAKIGESFKPILDAMIKREAWEHLYNFVNVYLLDDVTRRSDVCKELDDEAYELYETYLNDLNKLNSGTGNKANLQGAPTHDSSENDPNFVGTIQHTLLVTGNLRLLIHILTGTRSYKTLLRSVLEILNYADDDDDFNHNIMSNPLLPLKQVLKQLNVSSNSFHNYLTDISKELVKAAESYISSYDHSPGDLTAVKLLTVSSLLPFHLINLHKSVLNNNNNNWENATNQQEGPSDMSGIINEGWQRALDLTYDWRLWDESFHILNEVVNEYPTAATPGFPKNLPETAFQQFVLTMARSFENTPGKTTDFINYLREKKLLQTYYSLFITKNGGNNATLFRELTENDFQTALAIARQMDDKATEKAIHESFALYYMEGQRMDYQKALEHFKNANCYQEVIDIYLKLNNYESALQYVHSIDKGNNLQFDDSTKYNGKLIRELKNQIFCKLEDVVLLNQTDHYFKLAERIFTKEKYYEGLILIYKKSDKWDDVIRIAKEYLPSQLNTLLRERINEEIKQGKGDPKTIYQKALEMYLDILKTRPPNVLTTSSDADEQYTSNLANIVKMNITAGLSALTNDTKFALTCFEKAINISFDYWKILKASTPQVFDKDFYDVEFKRRDDFFSNSLAVKPENNSQISRQNLLLASLLNPFRVLEDEILPSLVDERQEDLINEEEEAIPGHLLCLIFVLIEKNEDSQSLVDAIKTEIPMSQSAITINFENHIKLMQIINTEFKRLSKKDILDYVIAAKYYTVAFQLQKMFTDENEMFKDYLEERLKMKYDQSGGNIEYLKALSHIDLDMALDMLLAKNQLDDCVEICKDSTLDPKKRVSNLAKYLRYLLINRERIMSETVISPNAKLSNIEKKRNSVKDEPTMTTTIKAYGENDGTGIMMLAQRTFLSKIYDCLIVFNESLAAITTGSDQKSPMKDNENALQYHSLLEQTYAYVLCDTDTLYATFKRYLDAASSHTLYPPYSKNSGNMDSYHVTFTTFEESTSTTYDRLQDEYYRKINHRISFYQFWSTLRDALHSTLQFGNKRSRGNLDDTLFVIHLVCLKICFEQIINYVRNNKNDSANMELQLNNNTLVLNDSSLKTSNFALSYLNRTTTTTDSAAANEISSETNILLMLLLRILENLIFKIDLSLLRYSDTVLPAPLVFYMAGIMAKSSNAVNIAYVLLNFYLDVMEYLRTNSPNPFKLWTNTKNDEEAHLLPHDVTTTDTNNENVTMDYDVIVKCYPEVSTHVKALRYSLAKIFDFPQKSAANSFRDEPYISSDLEWLPVLNALEENVRDWILTVSLNKIGLSNDETTEKYLPTDPKTGYFYASLHTKESLKETTMIQKSAAAGTATKTRLNSTVSKSYYEPCILTGFPITTSAHKMIFKNWGQANKNDWENFEHLKKVMGHKFVELTNAYNFILKWCGEIRIPSSSPSQK